MPSYPYLDYYLVEISRAEKDPGRSRVWIVQAIAYDIQTQKRVARCHGVSANPERAEEFARAVVENRLDELIETNRIVEE